MSGSSTTGAVASSTAPMRGTRDGAYNRVLPSAASGFVKPPGTVPIVLKRTSDAATSRQRPKRTNIFEVGFGPLMYGLLD